MKEHEPVVMYIRGILSTARKDLYVKTRYETALEISNMICGPDGCNFTCREPCEAMKFMIRTYLADDSVQSPQFKRQNEDYRSMMYDHVVASYG